MLHTNPVLIICHHHVHDELIEADNLTKYQCLLPIFNDVMQCLPAKKSEPSCYKKRRINFSSNSSMPCQESKRGALKNTIHHSFGTETERREGGVIHRSCCTDKSRKGDGANECPSHCVIARDIRGRRKIQNLHGGASNRWRLSGRILSTPSYFLLDM